MTAARLAPEALDRLPASQIADLLLAGRLRTVRCAFDPGEELSAI